ncbi:SusF/SusE family outer membrane protein [Bacteroides heparinolyticus]|uniref:SusF/SusE family outer membrane protein n=3 Tax=Prevotella heparinolytica TaxID=28113 RepID=UPI00359F94D4
MKKISIYTFLLAGLLSFSACESDRDSNPVLQEPTTFVLNTPAYVNTTYDLTNSKSVELTCSQPDFGYTAPVVYSVETSLTEDFKEVVKLDTKYTTAKMAVDASEMALAVTNLAVAQGKLEADFPLTTALYVRVIAELSSATEVVSSITSNVIKLPSVRTEFALPPVKLPAKLHLIGGFCDWDWGKSAEMIPCHDGTTGTFWRMVYIPSGTGVKFNTTTAWDGNEKGFAGCTPVDNYGAGLSNADGNIGVAKGGWYLIVIRSAVNGRSVDYTVEFNEPAVWLIGGAVKEGGDWTEGLADWKFTVPEKADDFFVSPAFAADAPEGPRAYVKVSGFDWWKSEFMVFGGKLTYRGAGKDLDRVTSKAGQKMYINFTSGAGKIE